MFEQTKIGNHTAFFIAEAVHLAIVRIYFFYVISELALHETDGIISCDD
jgi:hypothetical protein